MTTTRIFRRSALAALATLLIPSLLATTTNVQAAELPPDIGGIWQLTNYTTGVRTVDGQLPPLTGEGKAAYAANLAARKQMKPREDMSRCVPSGTPRAMFAPNPLMILQTARKITLVQEYQHQLRHIYMDEPVPDPDVIELSFTGESVGHWEGDMSIKERLRLIEGGKQLEAVMTFTDPAYYSAPWTTRIVFDSKPGVELNEYNCLGRYEDL